MSEGEGIDFEALLGQVQQLQQRLTDAQAEAAEELVDGTAGGGKVRVTMTGAGEVQAVHIDPSLVDPAEVEMLEDLLVVAFRDATARAAAQTTERMTGGGLLEGLLGGGLFGGDAIEASSHEADDEG
jgi:nucleoid-associated protein EbfC